MLCAAVLLTLGALSGCRQSPIDPGFRVPSPDETTPPAPARVDFTVPAGFVEAYNYQTGNDLHPVPYATFLIPIGADTDLNNLDVLSVVSYLMDTDVMGASDADLVNRVKGYATQVKSTPAEPVKTSVSGMTAFTLPLTEPKLGGGFYTYNATYIFSGQHLVQVMCQWEKQKALIDAACASLLGSVKIVEA